METVTIAFYVVVCVLLFSVSIAVHEFGHFIVALRLGLRVDAFSIGFGPAVWKKRIGGVEYRIGSIPFGGYVSLPDMDPAGTKALENGGSVAHGGKSCIAPWRELLVALAGPAMNIVLAVALAILLSLVPGARFGEVSTVIDIVVEGGPAEKAGIRPGDAVRSVGGHEVLTWTQMQTEVMITGGRETEFLVSRPREDGGEELLRLSVTPERDSASGAYFIMAAATNSTGAAAWMVDRNPVRQLAWDAGSVFRILKGLVTPREAKATAGALGGPLLIAESIYRSMRRSPWDGIGFVRFLNVNLAILNLLPIPVLDGGLIMFAVLALVFRRRVPAKLTNALSLGFMYLFIALMAFLVFKDSLRSWRIHSRSVDAAGTAAEPVVEGKSQ